MTHVELSLSEALAPSPWIPAEPEYDEGLDRWSATVRLAAEPCLVIDAEARIMAASASCCALLGLGDPAAIVGRCLLDGVLRLLDFTAARRELTEAELDTIPPLLALSSGRLARGLIRVQHHAHPDLDATVDAVATPLWGREAAVGALTFFSLV